MVPSIRIFPGAQPQATSILQAGRDAVSSSTTYFIVLQVKSLLRSLMAVTNQSSVLRWVSVSLSPQL